MLTYSPIFCWRGDSPLPGAGPVAAQGFFPLFFPWSPVRFLWLTMSLWWMRCPPAIAHFDALRDVSASHLAPYLVIYFMTSLPVLIFSHSKFSVLPTSARFARLAALHLVFGSVNEQALVECLLLQVQKKVTSSNSSKAIQCLLSVLCIVQRQYV